jgi:hypothetical protein
MSIGPTLIFDKSALQSLNPDEAHWLDTFFITNITPLFFIETLADLALPYATKRTPEQVVGDIAKKTPILGSNPNTHHLSLCAQELVGNQVEMRGVTFLSGGKTIKYRGETGLWFDESPETEAFKRWQNGQFDEIEKEFAQQWRANLSSLNFDIIHGHFKNFFVGGSKPKDFPQVKKMVTHWMHDESSKDAIFHTALEVLGISEQYRPKIIERWENAGRPHLGEFAPYTAHVFSVDLFFNISIAADLIARTRPSNKIDLSYLYYLPFCLIFTSGDHLHKKIVPLFLNDHQTFIAADQLKTELALLDQHYDALPPEVKAKGTMQFAMHPPEDTKYLITQLWDKYLPRWRESFLNRGAPPDPNDPKVKEILEKMKALKKGVDPTSINQVGTEKADHVVFRRMVPAHRGKWRTVSQEIVDHEPLFGDED